MFCSLSVNWVLRLETSCAKLAPVALGICRDEGHNQIAFRAPVTRLFPDVCEQQPSNENRERNKHVAHHVPVRLLHGLFGFWFKAEFFGIVAGDVVASVPIAVAI
jgi:hypothetical protein